MDKYMQLALDEARATLAEDGQPFGAVIVRSDEIIGVGRNQVVQKHDLTSHGEIEAIRNAGLQETFADTVMYTTAFPCLMCAGAIVRMGIPKVIVGASWAGSATSRAFMQGQGVELVELDLAECRELVQP